MNAVQLKLPNIPLPPLDWLDERLPEGHLGHWVLGVRVFYLLPSDYADLPEDVSHGLQGFYLLVSLLPRRLNFPKLHSSFMLLVGMEEHYALITFSLLAHMSEVPSRSQDQQLCVS